MTNQPGADLHLPEGRRAGQLLREYTSLLAGNVGDYRA